MSLVFTALLFYFSACAEWPDLIVPVPPDPAACEAAADALRGPMKRDFDVDSVVCWPAMDSTVLHEEAGCEVKWRAMFAASEARRHRGDYSEGM